MDGQWSALVLGSSLARVFIAVKVKQGVGAHVRPADDVQSKSSRHG